MIQELLGGAGVGVGSGAGGAEERKISIAGGVAEGSSSSSTSSSSEQQNLRCPRCDSSNTKFCYYNNYNLTQPRHFCKTCRRYWTKGGALRNVPIGGGCRKNKSSAASAAASKTGAGKSKPAAPDTCKANLAIGFDQELPSNPILWPSSHNSQLFALLRAAQNPNPNASPILNSVVLKEEMGLFGSHMAPEPAMVTSRLGARTLGLDPISQVPQVPIGLCSSFWRNNQQQQHLQQNMTLQQNIVTSQAQSTGIQELYQRLRSSANYHSENPPSVFANAAASSSAATAASIMEPAPVTTPELGYWTTHSPFSWSDLPTTNGAFP